MNLIPRITGSTQLFPLNKKEEKARLKAIKEEQKERQKEMKRRDKFLKLW